GSALPGEIDEAVDTELLAIGGAGLDDAVGEEQNAVSLLEGLLGGRGRLLPEPPRQREHTFELADRLTVANEQRARMTGVDPAQGARLQLELCQLPGSKRLTAELPLEQLVDRRADVGQRSSLPARVPVAPHDEGGDRRGRHPV